MARAIKKIPPELIKRLQITILSLAICRLCVAIPVPGIDPLAVSAFFNSSNAHTLFQMMDLFSGGAFAQMTIGALGIMPHISASIVVQILGVIVPTLQREMQETPIAAGRKLGRWTRWLSFALALIQSFLYGQYIIHLQRKAKRIIIGELAHLTWGDKQILFPLIASSTMTTATSLLIWLGDQISEHGIGNGHSLIISLGILSSLPRLSVSLLDQLNLSSPEGGTLTISSLVLLLISFVITIVGIISIIQGERRLPLRYARHGRESKTSFLPLSVNHAGVIPVIFASSLLMFPTAIAQLMPAENWLNKATTLLRPGSIPYLMLYAALIIFFTFFWTATQFHPEKIAAEMKKNGAFLPSIRQGKPTEQHLAKVMHRLTILGSISLASIALLPAVLSFLIGIDPSASDFFGGTSLLILVGVILETSKHISVHLLSYREFFPQGC